MGAPASLESQLGTWGQQGIEGPGCASFSHLGSSTRLSRLFHLVATLRSFSAQGTASPPARPPAAETDAWKDTAGSSRS